MLPKNKRLSAAQVREVLKKGTQIRGKLVSAKYTPSTSGRAAVVVSSKVSRGAITRNRLRRMVYHVLEQELPRDVHLAILVHTKEITPKDISRLCSTLTS